MVEKKEENVEENKQQWASLKPAEIEKIIVDLGKQGEQPAKIGLILRDKHGVPKDRLVGKKITQILKDAGVSTRTKKDMVKEKIAKLEKHIIHNNHDYSAKRSLTKKLWLVKD
ncbi:MAG: hypothetical protein Q8Q31_01160 [Nanoarchaeota archaeon]|nr:hypothetical protein [Nanoarchaeota archaeon]